MRNKKKKELAKKLYQEAEKNELIFKKMLDEIGLDTSKIKIIDRAKFTTKYIPDVIEELIEKYGISKILMDDEEIKNEALGLIQRRFHEDLGKQIVKTWNIYYLLRHCKISEPINIDENIILIPFNGWPCNDFLEVIDKLFYKLGAPASRLSEEMFENMKKYFKKGYAEKNPTGLLIFEKIDAGTEIEVYEKTKDITENIMLSVSNLTNSSIELSGWIVEGMLEGFKRIHPTIYFPYYKPTQMDPGALEKVTNIILEHLDDNHLLKLALKYENEALNDNEEKFRILKRWTALEFISEEYSQSVTAGEKLLTKQDIQKITNYIQNTLKDRENYVIDTKNENKIINIVSQINYKNIKDKVRELLHYSRYPITDLINSEKDIVDIIYQCRNCIIHGRGCPKDDPNIEEECDGPAYCRGYEHGFKKINSELSKMLTHIIGTFVDVEFEFHS